MKQALYALLIASCSALYLEDALASDTSALLDFKALDRNAERLPSWTGSVCAQYWEGVTCISGSVAAVVLPSRMLQGTLPESWSHLARLQIIDMGKNSVSGGLPASWSGLTNLQSLDMTSNRITGSLPDSWSRLTRLQTLALGNNSISGGLPASWSSLNVSTIYLWGNRLRGTLPDSWSRLTRLQTLTLGNNLISGTLPASWGSLNVSTLYLRANRLTGSLPESWSRLPSLQDLSLSSNLITGTLPEEWLTSSKTRSNFGYRGLGFASYSEINILLYYNYLTGSIPFPATGFKANLGIAPMNLGFGLCGVIPNNVQAYSDNPASGGAPLTGLLPSGHCPALQAPAPGPMVFSPPLPAPRNNPESQLPASEGNVTSRTPAGPTAGPTAISLPLPAPSPPPASSPVSTGAIIGASVGAAAALVLLLAACTWVTARRRRRHSQDQQGALAPGKLASSQEGSWQGSEPPHEAKLCPAAQATGGPLAPERADGVNHKDAMQRSAEKETAVPTASEQLNSWRSPWDVQKLGQPAAVDSAKSQHSQTSISSVSALEGDMPMPGPGVRCNPADSQHSPWENLPKGEGSVLSLLSTMQPRTGRATTLRDSATSEMSPVQLKQPAADADLPKGAKSFATGAWLRPAKLTQAAGSAISEESGPPPGRQSGELDSMWRLSEGSVTLCLDAEGRPIKLGQGGYGSVYLGKLRRRHSVAIKMVEVSTDRDRQRFIREICLLRECRDPNIVRFWGAQILQASMLLVMEYCHGGDLYHAMLKDYTDAYRWHKRGMQIALDVIHGLDYLHSQNIAHLDLKSPNILIDRDGMAKIADVGLSKLVGTREATATSAGSLLWAAPEQIEMKTCGTKSDVWAFGTILWEICTGEQLVTRHQQCSSGMDALPSEVLGMIGQCHQLNPAARPSASALKDQLLSLSCATS